MANFISSFFERPSKEKESTPLNALKKVLDHAIVRYQLASGIETASAILGLSNAFDLVRLEGEDVRNLTDLRNKISQVKEEAKAWQIAEKLLNSPDSVLRYCVASALANHLGQPQKIDLKNKTFSQLQELSIHQGKRLIANLQDKISKLAEHPKGYKK
jgi:hypothetical protein